MYHPSEVLDQFPLTLPAPRVDGDGRFVAKFGEQLPALLDPMADCRKFFISNL